MHGTWRTTGGGPDLAPVVTALVAAGLLFYALSWLAARAWWILGGLAALLVLAVVGTFFVWRGLQRAKDADLARIATARRAVQAEMNQQVNGGTTAPAIEQHVHYHYHAEAGPDPVRAIRVIPGTAGDAITTEGK